MPLTNKRKNDAGEKFLLPSKRTKLSSPSNGEPRRPIAGRQVRGDEGGEPSSRQQEMLVEQPEDPARDKFVTSAQEDLMQMIEERASDKAIENQMKIIKMFRARLLSNNGESQLSCGVSHMQPAKVNIREKTPAIEPSGVLNQGPRTAEVLPKPRKAPFKPSSPKFSRSQNLLSSGHAARSIAKGGASAISTPTSSSDFTRETRSLKKAREAAESASASTSTPSGSSPSANLTPTSRMTRSLTKGKEAALAATTTLASATTTVTAGIADPPSSPLSPSPAQAPTRRRKNNRFSATTKAAQPSKAVGELLKSARPAAAPTTLPLAQRTNKTLSATEVAQLSTVHSSFDAKATSRFHRHERKINRTGAMASYKKPVTKARGLKDRVRSPTQSPPEVMAAAAASSASASGMRLDAATLSAVPTAAAASAASEAASAIAANTTAGGVFALQPAVTEQQQPIRRGLPGQVFNQTLNRWIFVEESDDSDY